MAGMVSVNTFIVVFCFKFPVSSNNDELWQFSAFFITALNS